MLQRRALAVVGERDSETHGMAGRVTAAPKTAVSATRHRALRVRSVATGKLILERNSHFAGSVAGARALPPDHLTVRVAEMCHEGERSGQARRKFSPESFP